MNIFNLPYEEYIEAREQLMEGEAASEIVIDNLTRRKPLNKKSMQYIGQFQNHWNYP